MLNHVSCQQVIFLDIETVSQYETYDQLPLVLRPLWDKKAKSLDKDSEAADCYGRASLFAEFGKVICISIGRVVERDGAEYLRTMSFYGDDESVVLADFARLLGKRFPASEFYLCAHNGKGFDFPFLCRRMLINGIKIPSLLEVTGKKPWEVPHLDTMELWKFGDWKATVSLELLAGVFGIPTPKDDIDGSKVGEVYWKDNDLQRIERYCRKDVLTLAQVFRKFKGQDFLVEEGFPATTASD